MTGKEGAGRTANYDQTIKPLSAAKETQQYHVAQCATAPLHPSLLSDVENHVPLFPDVLE